MRYLLDNLIAKLIMNNKKMLSPMILKLEEDMNSGNDNAIDIFWEKIEREGAPLIEDIEGDEENSIVTVIWRQDREIDNIFVFSEIFGGWMFGEGDKKTNLYRLGNSDLWYRSAILSKKARCLYTLIANVNEEYEWRDEDVIIDPLNPKTYTPVRDEENPEDIALLVPTENIIEMPEAKEKIWTKERTDNKTGKIHMSRFKLKSDKKERRVWIYTPYGYEEDGSDNNLMVFTDGWEYINLVEAPKILDNLIGDRHISPTCAVFIESSDNRAKELICNNEYFEFITEDILPWVRENYKVTKNPKNTIITGLSLGGQFAAYAALNGSDIFGNVLSQSGAFAWFIDDKGEIQLDSEGNSKLIDEYKDSEVLPIDFYLNMGSLEEFSKGHVEANNRMIATLKSKGYNVTSETFIGAHLYYDWQDNLANGVKALLVDKQ